MKGDTTCSGVSRSRRGGNEDGIPGAMALASAPPPTPSAPRARRRLHRAAAALALVALLTSAVGVLAAVPAGSHLVAVGPISGDTGFPVWYKDSAGTRLEMCLNSETSATPFCGFAPGTSPNPNAALTVPATSRKRRSGCSVAPI